MPENYYIVYFKSKTQEPLKISVESAKKLQSLLYLVPCPAYIEIYEDSYYTLSIDRVIKYKANQKLMTPLEKQRRIMSRVFKQEYPSIDYTETVPVEDSKSIDTSHS